MADPTQDPGMGQDPGSSEEGQSFSVTITSNGDGTYSVSSSDSDSDPGEQGGGAQTAQSAEEACEIAEQMLQQEEQEDSGGDSGNAPLSGDQAASVWNQMASKRDKSRQM